MENETRLKQAEPLAALSIEFVAKPEEVHRLRSAIPVAVRGGLEHDGSFAGCLLMISDREARLVSVITFWTGEDRMTNSSKRTRRLSRLLTPYIDHCLRVQTRDAYLSALSSVWGNIAERESAPQGKTCSEQELPLCAA